MVDIDTIDKAPNHLVRGRYWVGRLCTSLNWLTYEFKVPGLNSDSVLGICMHPCVILTLFDLESV